MNDKVNHPKHYTSHPSGVECIQITEHYDFCIGNAIKYLWRQGIKNENGYDTIQKQVEDCKKAIWYINRHIDGIQKNALESLATSDEKITAINRGVAVAGPATTIPAAVFTWATDREASARARISNTISGNNTVQKSWLDCND